MLRVGDGLVRLGQRIPGYLVVALAILVATVVLSTTAIQRTNDADHASTKAKSLAVPVDELCRSGTAPSLNSQTTPDGTSVCARAAETTVDPTAKAMPAVTDDHIVAVVRGELARQPGPVNGGPSMAQVTAAVHSVMEGHPILFRGEAGPAPSAADVTEIVTTYVRANPAIFQGKDGAPGKDGGACTSGERQRIQVSGYTIETCVIGQASPETEAPHDSPQAGASPPEETESVPATPKKSLKPAPSDPTN